MLIVHLWPAGITAVKCPSQCCLQLVCLFELALLSFVWVNVQFESVISQPCLVQCSRSAQGFWSFWSHFNMTFIPTPCRVVSKAATACSRGNRWVTRGFTFTLPDANMAMAIGQLQHSKINTLPKSSVSVIQNKYFIYCIIITTFN